MLTLASTMAIVGCGSSSPSAPAPTVNTIQISGLEGVQALAPGETRQMRAMATQSNGTTTDVTAQATWQTSPPTIANVSGTGLLTAVAEGDVDVSATYQSIRASLRMGVRLKCPVSVGPSDASYSAFGGTATVDVTVGAAACRWSVRSDADWFPFAFEPSSAGSGRFTYTLPPNSTTAARSANLVVTSSSGDQAIHVVNENRPGGCSYVTQPSELTFSAAGGSGQFTVITTPGDCQWNLINGMSSLGVSVLSGFSGTGSVLVRYSVQAHSRAVTVDGYLEIAGLSGQNPNGRHHIIIEKR
jgi:Big-like domain-containing protein